MAGALPNLLVIGAMKAGTSALHYYLDLHPEVAMSNPKELDFFVDGRVVPGPGCDFDADDLAVEGSFEANWSKGIAWYERHFDPAAPVRGESSPSYSAPWYPDVPTRIASVLPNARLVFIGRDPVERSISNYNHQRALGREPRGIDEALANLGGPYVARSRYSRVLEPFFEHFPRASILVLTQEELRARRRETVQGVYAFAGVDAAFWSPKVERERYRGESKAARGKVGRLAVRSPLKPLARRLPDEAKWRLERALASRRQPEAPRLSADIRDRLADYLGEDVERLSALLGRSFPEWSPGGSHEPRPA